MPMFDDITSATPLARAIVDTWPERTNPWGLGEPSRTVAASSAALAAIAYAVHDSQQRVIDLEP